MNDNITLEELIERIVKKLRPTPTHECSANLPPLFGFGQHDETRILAIESVEQRTSLKRTAIYELIGQGSFPRPIPLTDRRKGWDTREVDKWIEDRKLLRDCDESSSTGQST
ncbi:MAG: AlpA family phage regulatory protein [Proteobacteria bacterium]|nr:AlpA family phage regulatory protein [Pseudomonadota bacterium]MCL2590570.1 AlpA family phage regulatory protein [Betaproteobacteria bacterium]